MGTLGGHGHPSGPIYRIAKGEAPGSAAVEVRKVSLNHREIEVSKNRFLRLPLEQEPEAGLNKIFG